MNEKICTIKQLIVIGVKKFNDDYFCNKCYERLDIEIERSDNHEIKYHKEKYPIEIVEDTQSLDENIIIAFFHVNHIGIQINHSKIQFSLVIQFNKIEIQTHFQNFLIKCAFKLINCVV